MSQPENQQSSTMEQVQDKAVEVKSQAGGQVRQQVDTRSTQAGEQVSSVAGALRRTSEQLREEGKEQPARLLEQGAERAERLGGYLKNVDSDGLLRDVESFGRRRPWLMAAGAAVLGLAASRFLRASSARRYQAAGDGGGAYGEPSYRRVPSPDVGVHRGTPAEAAWRGPDADLGEQARRSTTGQPT